MTLTVVVIPLFTVKVIGVNQKTGEVDPDMKPFENFILAGCLTVLKYLIISASTLAWCASFMARAPSSRRRACGREKRFLLPPQRLRAPSS